MTELQSLYSKYICIIVGYVLEGSQGTSFQRNMDVWVCHIDVVDGHRWRAEGHQYPKEGFEDSRCPGFERYALKI